MTAAWQGWLPLSAYLNKCRSCDQIEVQTCYSSPQDPLLHQSSPFQSRHAGVFASLYGIQGLVIESSGALLFICLPGDER